MEYVKLTTSNPSTVRVVTNALEETHYWNNRPNWDNRPYVRFKVGVIDRSDNSFKVLSMPRLLWKEILKLRSSTYHGDIAKYDITITRYTGNRLIDCYYTVNRSKRRSLSMGDLMLLYNNIDSINTINVMSKDSKNDETSTRINSDGAQRSCT